MFKRRNHPRRLKKIQRGFIALGLGIGPAFNGQWNPSSGFFTTSETGDWWDASDLPLMYQDSAGTVLSAVNQPVGLMLGQRYKGQRGAELVTNRDFSNGTASWAANGAAIFTVTNGQAKVENSGAAEGQISQVILAAGAWYEITLTVVAFTGSPGAVAVGGNRKALSPTVAVPQTIIVQSGGATNFAVGTNSGVAGHSVTVDNISVREVPGIHRYQTTSANRPTLSARYNRFSNSDPNSTGGTIYGTVNKTGNQTDPHGGTKAVKLDATGNWAWGSDPTTLSGAATKGSVALKADAPVSIDLQVYDGVTVTSKNVNVTTEWQRFTTDSVTPSGTVFRFGVAATFDVAGLYVADWDCRLAIHADQPGIPSYQRVNTASDYDTAGFPCYLSYNGTNSWMQTSAVDFSGTDKMTVVGAWTKLSDAAIAAVMEFGGANGIFALFAPSVAAAPNFTSRVIGSVSSNDQRGTPYAAPVSSVISFALNMAGGTDEAQNALRINGARPPVVTSTGMTTPQNFGNNVIYSGARAGTSLFFNGNEYISAIAGAAKTEALIARMERFAAQRAGLVI